MMRTLLEEIAAPSRALINHGAAGGVAERPASSELLFVAGRCKDSSALPSHR